MNRNVGLIGRKVGCTHLFGEGGRRISVTVVEAGPCLVAGKRTQAKDGYSALQLGYGAKPDRLVTKPVAGQFKRAGLKPARTVREFRMAEDVAAKYEVGQTLAVGDVFEKGEKVDVTSRSKGRGFAGVIKRHRFNSPVAGHGTHEFFRHGGSIGQNMNPGRTFPGVRMPGRMGACRVTVQGLRVVDVDLENGVILVDGSVPGPTGGIVVVRKSHRRSAPRRQQETTKMLAKGGAKRK
ncbi:MAG: 50S ribosomal protein L3 [Myxococcota bacterium]|nr:50S ribosomal protein L3 [Myxococcota bacterium]